MPTLAQGEARTIIVNPSGPPSNTLTAVLPPGVTISLESVLAAIDASGAGDTTATLTIADSSGAVIARKAQGQAVSGGVVGSATWALRLDDEATGTPGTGGDYVFIDEQVPNLSNNFIVFSNIPQTFRHLRMELALAEATGAPPLTAWINWNGGTVWSSQFTYVGSAPAGVNRVAQPNDGDGVYLNYGHLNGAGVASRVYTIPGLGTSNGQADYVIEWPYYRRATGNRHCVWQGAVWYGLIRAQVEGVGAGDVLFPAPAIDTITIGPGFGVIDPSSVASLYGIK